MKGMKKEKTILVIASLLMVAGSMIGLSLLIGHIQGKTRVSETVIKKEGKAEKGDQGGITDHPFQVLVSGGHMAGKYTSEGRTEVVAMDTILLVSVDPKEKKMLVTSVPRDTYIRKKKEKLYHAAYYKGIKDLQNWTQDLLDTKIDYYIQLNFNGFSTLIDAIGGVDVKVSRGFETDWGTSVRTGNNHFNGKEALAFARERHHLHNGHFSGDCARSDNNATLMKAILNKMTAGSITQMDADSLYQLWKKNVKTNIGSGEMLSLIRLQLTERPEWEIRTATLKGEGMKAKIACITDSSDGKNEMYVMEPDPDSLKKIQAKIDAFETK